MEIAPKISQHGHIKMNAKEEATFILGLREELQAHCIAKQVLAVLHNLTIEMEGHLEDKLKRQQEVSHFSQF